MTALHNIRAALEAVSSSGAWHKSGPAIDIDESDDWPVARVEVRANRLINRKIAAFIAACNPSAIRELLAYVESLEKDAGRYRVIRNREHGFILECDRPGWRYTIPWMQGTDAAIDAAMEQTK